MRMARTETPFGIADDEPEYQIEILPSEVQATHAAPMYMDPLDEGWFLEDSESHHYDADGIRDPATMATVATAATMSLELELEADEPPESPASPGASEVSFEDATREYQHGAGRPNPIDVLGPDPVTTEFHPEGTPAFGDPEDVHTPAGFGTQVTEHKKRDLGFVKATRDLEAAPPAEAPKRARGPSAPPELKITLRTPTREGVEPPPGPPVAGRSPTSPGIEAAIQAIELDAEPPPASSETIELSSAGPGPGSAADLIASLPSPKPAHSFATTRELPLPAITQATTQDMPVMPSAPTRELGEGFSISISGSTTQDFADRPTQEVHHRAPLDPMISAPTRELGLRPGRAPTEDEPTIAGPIPGRAYTVTPDGEGTRADHRAAVRSDGRADRADPRRGRRRRARRRRRRTIARVAGSATLLERASEWSHAERPRARRHGGRSRALARIRTARSRRS